MSAGQIALLILCFYGGVTLITVVTCVIQVWHEGKTFLSDESWLKVAVHSFNQGTLSEEDLCALDLHSQVQFTQCNVQGADNIIRVVYCARYVPKKN